MTKQQKSTTGEKLRQTNEPKSKTDNSGGVTLSVRGVSNNAKLAFAKAAKKAQLSQGEFFNTEVLAFLHSRLSTKPQPPAKLENMSHDIDELKQQQQAMASQLEALNKQLQQKPPTLWERIAGKTSDKKGTDNVTKPH